jgi:glycosyltransferase involved in cell wall biosynthesis
VGEAGILLDPRDVDGLCQSLLNLYHNSVWRQTLSVQSRQQAQRFSWPICAQQTLKAYRQALA